MVNSIPPPLSLAPLGENARGSSRSHGEDNARPSRLFVRKQSLMAFLLVLLVLSALATIDRTNLLDNHNYINYFRFSYFDTWDGFSSSRGQIAGIIALFVEEIGWQVYTEICAFVLEPGSAVVFTTLLITSLVFATALRTDHPLIFCVLWVLLPTALMTIGLYQIRQGLAFSILAYGISRKWPITAAVLASSIHITVLLLLVALLTLKLTSIISKKRLAFLVVILALALLLSQIGNMLFAVYGGRRVEIYDPHSSTASINFVISLVIVFAFYYVNLLRLSRNDTQKDSLEYLFAFLGIFVAAFAIYSFFFFPLGTSRISYFAYTFMIFVFSTKNAFITPKGGVGAIQAWNWATLVFIAYTSASTFRQFNPYDL